MKTFPLIINGALVQSKSDFEVINPATGTLAGRAVQGSVADLNAAVAAARAAFPGWAAAPDADRVAAVNKIGDLIEANAEELARLITAEQGKTLSALGSNFEVGGCVGWTRVTAGLSLPVETIEDNDEELVELHRDPIGVVGSITPWNWPLMIAIWHLMPAIRIGCTVVIKPSPYTPLSTIRLVELANTVLPKGVLNVVTGDHEVGDAMTAHEDIDKIVFTGSIPTGRRIMERAGPTLKKLTLELGGNDAGIILPGTDMSGRLEDLFWGSFINTGQTCSALKRLYVHADDYETVCAQIAEYLKGVPIGDGMDENNILGPLSNKMQFDKVCALVDDAKEKGARILCGGEPRGGPGYFYPLTLIADAVPDMRVVAEEQFGPVLPVIKYTDVEDAIAQANSLEVGLGASVWGDDFGACKAIARRLEAGTSWINRHAVLNPMAPMGGVKQSGIGIEFGEEGLREYTTVQVLSAAKPKSA